MGGGGRRLAGATWLLLLLSLAVAEGASSVMRLFYVENAVKAGAVCLDGSPAAYYFRRGRGVANSAWLVHFEGGGWCGGSHECMKRSETGLGSSLKYEAQQTSLGGVFSPRKEINPDFFNWNVVVVKYCDGASFTGYLQHPKLVHGKKLYIRGRQILRSLFDDLLSRQGMRHATRVIIGGDSAGGVATFANCDRIRAWLPQVQPNLLKCYVDAGLFTDTVDIAGNYTTRNEFSRAYRFHNASSGLNTKCRLSKPQHLQYLCYFPQYTLPHILTPLYVVNSFYDSYSLRTFFAPIQSDPSGTILRSCIKRFPKNCTSTQIALTQRSRNSVIQALKTSIALPNVGGFLYSCSIHTSMEDDNFWGRLRVQNTKLQQAFGDWIFDRVNGTRWLVDCPAPCNHCKLRKKKKA